MRASGTAVPLPSFCESPTMPSTKQPKRRHDNSIDGYAGDWHARGNIPVPQRHHIDRRADAIAAVPGSDDELLTTQEMAIWFGVSCQWLEIGRHAGWGPPFERLGPRTIRYRRGKARTWLDQRSHMHTAEYARSA
jgi:hypothetical protein